MKRAMSILAIAALVVGMSPASYAFDRGIPLVNTDKLSLSLWGRGQLLGVGQALPDPYADHLRIYEFLREARMGFNGNYEDLFKYQIELAYGGENQNTNQSKAGGYDLMDYVADVPLKNAGLGENTVFKIGQFRVPYGRESLGDEGYTDFADRSIANMVSNQGRDFGLAIMATHGNWTGTLGTFPGGGRDIAQRYLPERFGFPEVVLRAGYNDGVDEDIYHVMGTDRNLKRDTKAFFVSGLYTMDTRIGHSTSLLSHNVDNNLLVDVNYNPYMQHGDPQNQGAVGPVCSGTSCTRGHLYFLGTDGVWRHPLGNGQAIEAEAEANWAGYWNRYGTLHMASARAQGDYQVGKWTFGARYAILSIGKNAGTFTTTAPSASSQASYQTVGPAQGYSSTAYETNSRMGQPIHEITPSITYHFKGHNMKLIADLPIYLDAPLFIDHLDGAYAMTDPTGTDQVSNMFGAGNNMVRRTYASGRMLFQFQF